jgi:hypothetical protein
LICLQRSVTTNLPLKRLRILGLPSDIINLVSAGLKERWFKVRIDGVNSILFDLLLGTVKDLYWGLYFMRYLSRHSDIDDFYAFVDYTLIPKWNASLPLQFKWRKHLKH